MISSRILSIVGALALIGVLLFTQFDDTAHDKRIAAPQASGMTETINIVSAGEADMVIYSNLEEVENNADLIIVAERIGERTAKSVFINSMAIETYGVAEVKVVDVYKGDVRIGDELKVAEPGYFNESGNYVSFEGYKVMNKEGKYILFLRTGSNNEQIVLGLYQGKFDLELPKLEKEITSAKMSVAEFDDRDYVGDNVWQFNKLKKQVLEKYGEY